MQPDGLIAHPSSHSPGETLDRLQAELTARGIKVFARIDHAAEAATVGMALRPTTVIIFGNPQAGTPLMQQAQTMGIDLPLKMLVWQDDQGKTWLGYNDLKWLAHRHGLPNEADRVVDAMQTLLATLANIATAAGS